MANIITELHLEMSANWYVSKKLNSIGRVGENTVTKLIIEPTEILDNVTYELEIMSADGSKNVAELTIDGTELYLILTANMLTTSGITKMQVRGLFTDGSIKKSNIFELKVNRSISATEHYEEYAVTIFDQLVQDCRDIIEGAESYAVRAETAATNAEAYSEAASASADAASASATTATNASTTATIAAETATAASTSASTSAETATTAAASASASATTATSASESAQTSANTASTSATAAVNASNTATSAASNAETAANSASTSANNASASATSAAADATNAAISEANASTSATNAHTSETNAVTSATNAANSASSASTSATNAANSATAAATSATNAHTSEVNANTSETNASASATEAAETAESIAASVAQINENTYRINDLEAIIGGYQLTDLPTGAVATITDGTALLMPSLKVDIEPVQSGSGDPSPENIRPISGWTEANVTRCGKNLADVIIDGYVPSISNGQLVQANGARTDYIPILPSETYTLQVSIATWTLYLFYYDENKNFIRYANGTGALTGTTPSNAKYTMVRISGDYTIGTDTCQLELGSTATAYEPYNGTTYTIQFTDGDNPLTVYGGTLNAISGLLTVTDAYIASYNAETLPSTWISDRDVYAEGTTPTTGAEVVYKLANSVTYHLTPTQIRTLVGNNNIWANTGDVLSGKYYRSPF